MSDSATALNMDVVMEQARKLVHDGTLPAAPATAAAPVAANTNEAPKPEAAAPAAPLVAANNNHAPTKQATDPVAANLNCAPLPAGVKPIYGSHVEALGLSTEPMTPAKALENAGILYAKAAVCFAGLAQELQKQAANSPQQPQR